MNGIESACQILTNIGIVRQINWSGQQTERSQIINDFDILHTVLLVIKFMCVPLLPAEEAQKPCRYANPCLTIIYIGGRTELIG
jgi:hypothetical protein